MAVGLEIDPKLVRDLQRVAEQDQTEALTEDLLQRVVRPMLRAISALINQNPGQARKGLHVELHVQAVPVGGEFLTTREVAERFRVSQQQVRRWCDSGTIQAERTPGGTWRIPSSQFTNVGFFVNRVRRRRSIRSVAGAWKDHPELLQALRDQDQE